MKRLNVVFIALVLLIISIAISTDALQAGAVNSHAEVDQFQLDASELNHAIHRGANSWQTFTVGKSGQLVALELSLFASRGPTADLGVQILDANGGILGAPVLGTVMLSPSDLGPAPSFLNRDSVTATLIDLSELDISASAGDQLGFRLFSNTICCYAVRITLSDRYPDGTYYTGVFTPSPLPFEAAFKTFMRTVTPVDIDIKPGSDPNCINNNGHGVIPVAILTTDSFDASTVDPTSLSLDGAVVREKGKSGNIGSLEDVDADGDLDLVVHFADTDLTYQAGDTVATLSGETFDGTSIEGTDSICLVP